MDFIDTNVIVYANDRRDPRKQDIALNVIGTAMRQRSGVISVQVLQEYANTALAKLRQQPPTVLRQLALLESLTIVRPDAKMVRRSVELQSLFAISFWDASILAAAESAGCRRVLSEDLSDGGIYGTLSVWNPFAE
jgi:predicted nucleic acid-binding protein